MLACCCVEIFRDILPPLLLEMVIHYCYDFQLRIPILSQYYGCHLLSGFDTDHYKCTLILCSALCSGLVLTPISTTVRGNI